MTKEPEVLPKVEETPFKERSRSPKHEDINKSHDLDKIKRKPKPPAPKA